MAVSELASAPSDVDVPVEEAAFSRQRDLDDFDDRLIQEQVCMVVGSGGVGSCVGLTLARLGVKHISFFDFDTVAASNLNRQLLFSRDQVGMLKASACKESVDRIHSVRTTAAAINGNAVTGWATVVAEAEKRGATAFFNGCDHGSFFDAAVQSLAIAMHAPYTAASTYAYTYQLESHGSAAGQACSVCNSPPEHPINIDDFTATSSSSSSSSSQADGALAAATAARSPITASEVLTVLQDRYDCDHDQLPDIVASAMGEAAILAQWDDEDEDDAAALGAARLPRTPEGVGLLRQALTRVILSLLAPERIKTHTSIGFIPKDPKPHTAAVGSWVVVCAAGSMMAVNSWVQRLAKQDVPEMTLQYINARTGQDWRDSPTWEGFKFHCEPTDGCPICGFKAPLPPTKDPVKPREACEEAVNVRLVVAALAGLTVAGLALVKQFTN